MTTADGWVCVDGNEAAARVAHRLSEIAAIYPIRRPWGELAGTWSAAGRAHQPQKHRKATDGGR